MRVLYLQPRREGRGFASAEDDDTKELPPTCRGKEGRFPVVGCVPQDIYVNERQGNCSAPAPLTGDTQARLESVCCVIDASHKRE